jgi:hypothetical protein
MDRNGVMHRVMRFYRRIMDKIRCPVCGMTMEQQDVVRNALWAARGILLHSRNARELGDQDYTLVCKRFDQIDDILTQREEKK